MWELIEEYFLSSELGLAMLMAVLVTAFIITARITTYYTTEVMPKRMASSSNRGRCEKLILGKLRGYEGSHDCRILKQLELSEDATADVVLLGRFGVKAFVGCDEQGELYPVDEDIEEITTYISKKKLKCKNPMQERNQAERIIRQRLKAAGIKIPSPEVTVVFTHRRCTPVAPKSDSFCRLSELKDIMAKPRYDLDCGLDLDEVERALLGTAEEQTI